MGQVKASLVIVVMSLLASAFGQNDANLSQVTLYSVQGYKSDFSRASINFETGERGVMPEQSYADFDITYGTLTVGEDKDWFRVRDPRSMIIDLGKKNWSNFKETPPFPKLKRPRPLKPPMTVDASADSREVSPYKQYVKVVAGHMYLIRVKKGNRDLYIMCRVENLISMNNCTVTWKKVPPPNEKD